MKMKITIDDGEDDGVEKRLFLSRLEKAKVRRQRVRQCRQGVRRGVR